MTCHFCRHAGKLRRYHGRVAVVMTVVLCERCDFEFSMKMATPAELEIEVSRAVNAMKMEAA